MKNLGIHISILILLLVMVCAGPAAADDIDTAIEKGVAWIATHQNPAGYWYSTGNGVGYTGLNVLKLEDYAWEQGIDPLSDAYIYKDQVKKGLAYLFSRVQTSGTHKGSIYASTQCYETAIAIMAISASRHPEMDSGIPDGLGGTLTYKQVVENAADYLVRAQVQTGTYEGGWRYSLGYTSADNSVSGWVTLGLVYAKNLFGVPIPATTLAKLDKWIDYIQTDSADWKDGGSGYLAPGDGYVDSFKTGNLLFQCAMVGDTVTTPRVQRAISFIERHWTYNSWDRGWHYTPHGNIDYQTTFGMMKGLEAFGIDTLNVGGDPNFDWYGNFSTEIIIKQNADGSWPSDLYGNTYLTTPWALLTLERTVEIPATFEVAKSVDKTTIDAGETVTYTYLVKNTGFKDILSLVLTDNKLGVIAGPVSGDDDNDGVLDPLETWTYSKSTKLYATTTNTATAEGEDNQANIVTTTSNAVTVIVRGTAVPEFSSLLVPVMLLGVIAVFVRYAKKE